MLEISDIPSILRQIRDALGLTQEQLAERLDVSFATVNRWEGGNNAPQKAAREQIAALAEEAGIVAAARQNGSPSAAAAPRRRQRASAAPTTKPMEQMLWDAACSIRGEKDVGSPGTELEFAL